MVRRRPQPPNLRLHPRNLPGRPARHHQKHRPNRRHPLEHRRLAAQSRTRRHRRPQPLRLPRRLWQPRRIRSQNCRPSPLDRHRRQQPRRTRLGEKRQLPSRPPHPPLRRILGQNPLAGTNRNLRPTQIQRCPHGRQKESDTADFAKDPDGKTTPKDSHMRLANPRDPEFMKNTCSTAAPSTTPAASPPTASSTSAWCSSATKPTSPTASSSSKTCSTANRWKNTSAPSAAAISSSCPV